MARQTRYSQEVRERAVRLVLAHQEEHTSQWQAILSIAEKIGCTAKTLRRWVKQVEIDSGQRGGISSEERVRIKELDRRHVDLLRAKSAGG